ncbi:MAG: hypothetical protein RLZZ324_431 [Candidatus Parcubacteria bacterium]|jgi:uncharacterized LabA/DUF88 family protein
MIKHKSQRVGVFMDVQNMYYSAKKLYNSKVNFGAILETAVADRQLIRAIAYVVRATGDEGAFFEALKHRGLETKERPVQVFESGAKKADWDVGMTVDAIRIGEILDVIVLVSGDGDFVELVDYLKHHGRQVEVIAFRETTSSKLVGVADDFIDLSKEMEKYLIKPPTGGATRNPQRGRSPRPPKGGSVEREVGEKKSDKPAARRQDEDRTPRIHASSDEE